MKILEKLLTARQYYLIRITEAKSSVVHNNKSKKKLNYYNQQLNEVEAQIKELLDNNELE